MAQASNGNVVPLGDHPRARARLTPQESATVLSGCRDLALDRMTRAMSGMLDTVEDELLALADKSADRESRNVFLDARAQARQKRYAMEATFRQHFAEFFNRKVRGDSGASARSPSGELALVAHEDLEETLAVAEMARKLKAACEGELFALRARMGFLLERPDLEEDANPVSPATICAALKDACDQIEAGRRVRMILLQQIEHHAEGLLQGVYRDLNAHLVERSILPDVRPTARRNPGSPAPAKQEAPAAAPPTAPPVDLFATLAQLMAPAPGGAAEAVRAPAGDPPPAGEAAMLLAELTRMHRADAAVTHLPRLSEAGSPINVVRELKKGPQAASLSTVDAMTIDIVAMVFDYVFEDRHIPDSVKVLLGRLQIPTLKVALLDKSFFSSNTHPARRLIDALAAASIGVDAANPRGAATLALVEHVVGRVLEEFDSDLGLFESLVSRVEAFVAEGRQAEEDLVARSAAIIEAREREEGARAIAHDEVARQLQSRVWVPPAVREMLFETWVRALADAQCETGEGGPAWQALVRTMENLLWSVEPKPLADDRKRLVAMLPGMLHELHLGFARAKLSQAGQDVFLGMLVDCHSNAVKAGLRGLAVLPDVPPPPPVAEEPRIERELLPAGDVQVEQIRLKTPRGSVARNVFTRTGVWTHVQRGTWVEFAREGAGATRARLTWISPNKGVYLFTNPASSAVAVSISPEALAEQMRRGEARMLDDAPLVERAVDSVIASLKRGEGAAA